MGRFLKVIFLSGILAAILLGYQNCSGPASTMGSAQGSSSTNLQNVTCNGHPVNGKWELGPEILEFKADCSGTSKACNGQFTYSVASVDLSGTATLTVSSANSAAGCLPIGTHACTFSIDNGAGVLNYSCSGYNATLVRAASPLPTPAPTPAPVPAPVPVPVPVPAPVPAPAPIVIPSGAKRIYTATEEVAPGSGVIRSVYRSGNLGGIAGADALCGQRRPTGIVAAKALIVDGISRRACVTPNCATNGVAEHIDWVLKPSTQYVSPGGRVIGSTNSVGIFSFPLMSGFAVGESHAFTGLVQNWVSSSLNCNRFTSNLDNLLATTGDLSVSISEAISRQPSASVNPMLLLTCNTAAQLICVEQ